MEVMASLKRNIRMNMSASNEFNSGVKPTSIMKARHFNFFLLGIMLLLIASCGEENETKEPILEVETTPSAKPEDDTKASGVYKGSFVGSSGTFKLVVQLDMIAGFLSVDGARFLLTTKDITTADLGKAITNALFTDSQDWVRLRFSVDADGSNPIVDLEINGHTNIQVVVMKETSESQVLVYEGYRYSTHPLEGVYEKGIVNVVLDVDSVILIAYKTDSFVALNNGHTGTVPEEAWINNGIYYYQGDQMIMTVNHQFKSIIPTGIVNINEKEIWGSNQYEYENFPIADSVRLVRKL